MDRHPGLSTNLVPLPENFLGCVPLATVDSAGELTSTIAVELTFLSDAFERFFGALDAVLVVIAIGGKQLHHSIAAIAGHMTDRPGRKVDRMADLELMLFQHTSPELVRTDRLKTPELPFIMRAIYSSEMGVLLEKVPHLRAALGRA
jgi:hypothetical protein